MMGEALTLSALRCISRLSDFSALRLLVNCPKKTKCKSTKDPMDALGRLVYHYNVRSDKLDPNSLHMHASRWARSIETTIILFAYNGRHGHPDLRFH